MSETREDIETSEAWAPHSREGWLVIWMEGDWQRSKRFRDHAEALSFAETVSSIEVIPTPSPQ